MADDKDKREIYVDNNLVGYIRNKFQEAETSKIYDEYINILSIKLKLN